MRLVPRLKRETKQPRGFINAGVAAVSFLTAGNWAALTALFLHLVLDPKTGESLRACIYGIRIWPPHPDRSCNLGKHSMQILDQSQLPEG